MARILIVEDDKRICEILKDYLTSSNHECRTVMDGLKVISSYVDLKPQLVILDLMLPNLDGFKICQILRSISEVPIIILTSKGEEVDKLKGYELGADDYMTKPFSPRVLVAKVNALLKRSETEDSPEVINIGMINLDTLKREVYISGEQINLTYKEFELLHILMKNPGIVFSRDHLLNKVWGYDFSGETRTVDTHIKTLRQKLGYAGSYIVTMIRSGYKFEVKE